MNQGLKDESNKIIICLLDLLKENPLRYSTCVKIEVHCIDNIRLKPYSHHKPSVAPKRMPPLSTFFGTTVNMINLERHCFAEDSRGISTK